MDEQAVRDEATFICDAIVAGDMGPVIEHLSNELRQNIGEVVALMPLPASAATIELVELGGSSYNVTIRITGDRRRASSRRAGRSAWTDRRSSRRATWSRVEMAPPTDADEASGEDESSG